jgi:hypothetical protein
MRIFSFDPAEYRQQFAEQGLVHIKNGVDPAFLEAARAFSRRSLEATKLDQFAIKGKKEQSLFDFPDDTDYPDEIFDVVSEVCALNRPTMTLSERHIQAYEANANPDPRAHKDRFPSQVSVGFSIDIPRESRLVLYPYDHRELNPFNKAAALLNSMQPHEQPEVVLKDAREVEIDDEPGDVVMFHGSTTWHLRRRSAGAVNLYVKLNDFDHDPLGEDPFTAARRERTMQIIGNGGYPDAGGMVAAKSRRLDFVSRQYAPHGEHESLHAALYGDEPFGITPAQLEVLRSVDGRRTLDDLVAEVAARGSWPPDEVRSDTMTLLERGAVDLI